MRWLGLMMFLLCCVFAPPKVGSNPAEPSTPLVMGETFTLKSAVLGEIRRINVYIPPGVIPAEALPVLYMPDGGMGEDFLHVAGLVQVSVGNGTMRPFLLVGIENTERRRDLTGPTENENDKKIAPRIGGSEAFRRFLRDELMPAIQKRYQTTKETAIIGESLAGLFIVETFLLEPSLFDTYIALDPSLWWNNGRLVKEATTLLDQGNRSGKTVFLATSNQAEIGQTTGQFERVLNKRALVGLRYYYEPMPQERHQTIFHPAALKAFRTVFAPQEKAALKSVRLLN